MSLAQAAAAATAIAAGTIITGQFFDGTNVTASTSNTNAVLVAARDALYFETVIGGADAIQVGLTPAASVTANSLTYNLGSMTVTLGSPGTVTTVNTVLQGLSCTVNLPSGVVVPTNMGCIVQTIYALQT